MCGWNNVCFHFHWDIFQSSSLKKKKQKTKKETKTERKRERGKKITELQKCCWCLWRDKNIINTLDSIAHQLSSETGPDWNLTFNEAPQQPPLLISLCGVVGDKMVIEAHSSTSWSDSTTSGVFTAQQYQLRIICLCKEDTFLRSCF